MIVDMTHLKVPPGGRLHHCTALPCHVGGSDCKDLIFFVDKQSAFIAFRLPMRN